MTPKPPQTDAGRFSTLAGLLSPESSLLTNLTDHEEYLTDATEEPGKAAAVVIAATESDVVATLRFCHRERIPVVPRGTGTGLSGGCVPDSGSLVLSVERLKGLTIDPEKRVAVCQAGVITNDLMIVAAPFGLTYPPDPASYRECSLGGNIAENAGGLRCQRFGVTRDYVLGLRAVTVAGEIIKTGWFADSRGFSLGELFIGSEGTLVIVTEMALRLIPTPARGSTILVAFEDPADAAETVSAITAAGIIPTVMEYLDGNAAKCSNEYEPVAGLEEAGAILLIETAGERDEEQKRQISAFCRRYHSSFLRTADSPESAEALWAIRRNLSKAITAAARFRYNEDVAVPVSRFMTLISFVAEMNRRGPLRVNAFGHAGDGNLHVSLLSATGSRREQALISKNIEALLKRTVELGGTVSGEHGIGRHKRRFLTWEFSESTLEYMRRIKQVFDPTGLLNPNKIF